MFINKSNWGNVLTIAICLTVTAMFSGCDLFNTPEETVDPSGAKILTSPIKVNTTLKASDLPVDYIYKGAELLEVTDNAVLTIEPGVTIKFAHSGRAGGIKITEGATIKAIGTADKRIRFIGVNEEKGSWAGIKIESKTDNRFSYCDFINAGNLNSTLNGTAAMYLWNAKAGFSYCKISNGLGYGLHLHSDAVNDSQLSTFDNNVIEGFNNHPPVRNSTSNALKVLEKFDMTSDFTNNAKAYIETNSSIIENVTLKQTTVPYYFVTWLELVNSTLTINEGITIYLAEGLYMSGNTGKIIVNGTAAKKVKFTRLPGVGLYFWSNIDELPGSVFNHCIFEYGGSAGVYGVFHLTGSTNLTLNNVEINNSNTYGAVISSPYNLNHSNVTFSGNRDGNVYDGWHCSCVLTHFP